MNSQYRVLFEVEIRHTFYTGGTSEDLRIEPTPYCARLLRDHGLLFRDGGHGFAVLAETDPTNPAELLRPFGGDTLKLSFVLLLANPYFPNISDLPAHDARSLFYFNNVSEDIDGDTLHLADSADGARVGAAIEVVAGSTYAYQFDTAVSSAVLELRDLFDTLKDTIEFSPSEAVDSVRLDLDKVDDFPPGRYVMSDDQGGERAFYYDPELYGRNVFGLIEIFHGDEAHPSYRFLTNDGKLAPENGSYTLQFEARKTTRRYVVIKQYDTNDIILDALAIAGSVVFTEDLDTDRVTFISNAMVLLAEADEELTLVHNGTDLLDLPSPTVRTPLQAGISEGTYTSELYIYL